ncbi:MAG: hypothetical protein PHN72_04585 [Bacilli bacterium]|nr:hypothetical protein [Bacilli bacterium]
MYEEKKDRFSVRDLVLQILFIALFVFLLLWLFPTKGDLTKLSLGSNKNDKETNTVLYDRIFNENIIAMKDAAKSYYTTPRLPQNVGDKVAMTLGEMFEKKILLTFTDKNGKSCDKTNSYVEVTKENDEYVMKVNLNCSGEENYLLVYMGCYDYCSTTICEKNKEDIATPVVRKVTTGKTSTAKQSNTTNVTNVTNITNVINNVTNNIINVVCPECCPKPGPTPTPNVPTPTPTPNQNKTYECEYLKVVNAQFTAWSTWSNWTDKVQYTTQLKQVKSKTERTTVTQNVITGYKVTTYKDSSKPIYKQVQVQSGTKTEKKCASYGTQNVSTGQVQYGAWVSQGELPYLSKPTPTDTTTYVFVSTGPTYCPSCNYENYNIYRKYTRTATPVTTAQTVCTGYTTEQTPLYTVVNVLSGYETSEKREPIYEKRQAVVDKKYYSTRIRGIKAGQKDIKWDVCDASALLNNGYSKTGTKREK